MGHHTRLGVLAAAALGLTCGLEARAQSTKPGYELTFNDEFTGSGIDRSRWQLRYKWGEAPVNGELQAYVDDAFSFDGEVAHILGQDSPGDYANQTFAYRSGLLASVFHQRFGWFEIRCQMPRGQGFWPAFWLLGENGTSGVNEIDIHEYLGDEPSTMHMTLHWGTDYGTGHKSDGTSYIGADFSAAYHTFAVDWDAARVIWYVDGVERFRHTGEGVPQVEMYVIANLAVGGDWPGAPDASTVFPGDYAIDYIRVYKKAVTDPGAGAGGTSSTSGAGTTAATGGSSPGTGPGTVGQGGRGVGAGGSLGGGDPSTAAEDGDCGCRVVGGSPQAQWSRVPLIACFMGLLSRRRRSSIHDLRRLPVDRKRNFRRQEP